MSAKVLHGRRRGSERDLGPEDGISMPEPVFPTKMPTGADLRQVAIITKSNWERIGREVNRRQIEEERIRKIVAEREEKREKAKDIVKNWGNTIAGQRLKRLETLKIRQAIEEEAKKNRDIEEAQYQANMRKEAIEKAKTLQYYQTDRVKSFHSALLLSEVLKEREAQIELKQLKGQASQGREQEWLEQERRLHEEAIQKDHMKAEKRIAVTNANAEFQKAQIREHMRLASEEKEEDVKEGEELKKLAKQHHVEIERLTNITRDEQKHVMFENLQQQKDVKRLKEISQMQEDEEDEECRIFATAKRKMVMMRAEKENEIYRKKQNELDRIRGKLAAQNKAKLDDEDERIRQAVKEKDEKQVEEDEQRAQKVKRMIAESAAHRQQQMGEHEAKKKKDRQEELEMLKLRKESDDIFYYNEGEKVKRRLKMAKDNQAFYKRQMDNRDDHESRLRQDQLALDKANVDLLEVEEKQFQEYASKVIEHCEKGGRNVYPLRKAAKEGAGGGVGPIFAGKGGLRPSYMVADYTGVQMPHYRKDSSEQVKGMIGNKNTKKNMGFVW